MVPVNLIRLPFNRRRRQEQDVEATGVDVESDP